MRFLDIQAAIGTAILLLSLPCDTKHGHGLSHLDIIEKRHAHKRSQASPRADSVGASAQKRGTQCPFPTGKGLVAVTPGEKNAGWAMSPDQPCLPGNYCPYACPPGEVMAQWNPLATSYTYPESMDGGLYCDENGDITLPFPNNPYCVPGTGAASAVNPLSDGVAFCQTVLPGNEAMLIPTWVKSSATLAIPGTSYWCETASHFYINAPGVTVEEACIWGDGSSAIGNWAPYVAGGNTVANGETFLKLAWNPIFTGCDLSSTLPTFGIEITCADGVECNGLPCKIDPTNGLNVVTSSDSSSGAGGANFCVVTVPSGATANIVLFEAGSGGGNGGGGSKSTTTSKAAATTTTPKAKSTTPTSTKTTASTTSTTSVENESSTAASTTSSSSSFFSQTGSATYDVSTISVNTTLPYPTAGNSPHILFQNASSVTGLTETAATEKSSGTALSTGSAAASTTTSKSDATGKWFSTPVFTLSVLHCLFIVVFAVIW